MVCYSLDSQSLRTLAYNSTIDDTPVARREDSQVVVVVLAILEKIVLHVPYTSTSLCVSRGRTHRLFEVGFKLGTWD
jgi:hypothetical protein